MKGMKGRVGGGILLDQNLCLFSGWETFGQLLSLLYLHCKLGSTKTLRLCRCTRRLLKNTSDSKEKVSHSVDIIASLDRSAARCFLCIAVEHLDVGLSSRASLCHAEAFRP